VRVPARKKSFGHPEYACMSGKANLSINLLLRVLSLQQPAAAARRQTSRRKLRRLRGSSGKCTAKEKY